MRIKLYLYFSLLGSFRSIKLGRNDSLAKKDKMTGIKEIKK